MGPPIQRLQHGVWWLILWSQNARALEQMLIIEYRFGPISTTIKNNLAIWDNWNKFYWNLFKINYTIKMG